MRRTTSQPTIAYTIHDDDAIIQTVYHVIVSYTKCPGYRSTWGYNGGCPGEPNHVEDVTIEEVALIELGSEAPFRPTSSETLEAIRERFDDCERIAEACHAAAFGERDYDRDE